MRGLVVPEIVDSSSTRHPKNKHGPVAEWQTR